jgi:outer membrane receptor protein involved in Fe transport
MKKMKNFLALLCAASLFSIAAKAQSVVGVVKNASSGEKVAAVSVVIKGTETGTFTDDKGNFKLNPKSFPITIVFTSIGYAAQEVVVNEATKNLEVNFVSSNALGQEVVISATRVSQRILESPVSVERVSAATLRNAPAANFYDVVANLKGVDVTTSSLTFKTPTTRGFNSSGNTRFNQLVDGMDNQAPGLNFSVGAIIGLSELDVDNIELLSGASSALYGPGGMNGTLLMTSKNPFKYQGFSFLVKQGVMHVDERQRKASPYFNWNVRWGKKVSEKFAFKINAELIQAKDWLNFDDRNYKRTGTTGAVIAGDRQSDANYDGINQYGDETSIDLRAVFSSIASAGLPGATSFIASQNLLANPMNVSRTGYSEKDLVNPNTINFKVAGSLHYKVTPKIEAILAGYWGTGNTIYTGSERYSIRDFKMGQYKLELQHKNWMLRAYTTQENSGESYNLTATTQFYNEAWKPSPTWYQQYGFKYLSDRMSGISDYNAHQNARSTADIGRPQAGTAAFQNLYDQVRLKPISKGGGRLTDATDLYSVEGNYNLSEFTKDVADILVGANYRKYVLNSEGTLFADTAGTIGISEIGAFIQATRKVTDRLKVTASGRYDKNQNFEGRFTPRFTAVYEVAKNNNVRFSYQTAYRFPSTQQQYINLGVGSTRLVGGNASFKQWLNVAAKPLYDAQQYVATGAAIPVAFEEIKPEVVGTFELGYKGLVASDKLLIDAYGYYGQYKDFLSRFNTRQFAGAAPTLGEVGRNISIVVNAPGKVTSFGWGASFDYRLPKNFLVGFNIASDELTNVPANFVAYFNAPKYKTNFNIGNNGFGPSKRIGANVTYKWQQSLFYQGDFANGQLPDIHTVDAQISYKLPATKSIIKLGANNLLNEYYYNAIGNSQIGGLYYVSFGFNVY